MGPDRVTKALARNLEKQQRRGAIGLHDAYEQAVLFLNMRKGDWHMQSLMGTYPQISADKLEQHVQDKVRLFLLSVKQ